VKQPPGAFVLPAVKQFPEKDMLSLRHMPLVCLLAPCLALYAQPRNPYDLELQHLQKEWSSADKLEKLALLDDIERLRDYVNDRNQVQSALETIRQSNTEDPLVKAEAAACLDDLRAFAFRRNLGYNIGTPNQSRASECWLKPITIQNQAIPRISKSWRSLNI